MKICKKCDIQKNCNEFHKQTRRSDGLHPWCKSCCSEYGTANQSRKNKATQEWRNRNPVTNKLSDKLSKQRRKDQIRKEQREWQKRTRIERPSFRLAQNIRNRIRLALKGETKSGSTFDYIGCSLEELKSYLESKFQPGMTWDNYGQWHVDHKLPLSKFDLTIEDNMYKLNHYSNLQPLWAKENLRKGAKIE